MNVSDVSFKMIDRELIYIYIYIYIYISIETTFWRLVIIVMIEHSEKRNLTKNEKIFSLLLKKKMSQRMKRKW